MDRKTWEEYLWTNFSLVAVPDLNANVINVLDIYRQSGSAFFERSMVRIGSMTANGDGNVKGWSEKSKELKAGLESLSTAESACWPFIKADLGHDRNYNGKANSTFAASLLQLAHIKLAQSHTLSIDLKAPLYHKYDEDELAVLIQKSDWKPDIGSINTVERKGVSCLGREELMELWIITELHYAGSVGYKVTGKLKAEAQVSVPSAELVVGAPVDGAVNLSSSGSDTRTTTSGTIPTKNDILYGFKAIRVKFDMDGNYISRRGTDNMGKPKLKVRAKKMEFDPEEDPGYHMLSFFNSPSGEGGSITSGGDSFTCVPLLSTFN